MRRNNRAAAHPPPHTVEQLAARREAYNARLEELERSTSHARYVTFTQLGQEFSPREANACKVLVNTSQRLLGKYKASVNELNEKLLALRESAEDLVRELSQREVIELLMSKKI